MNKKPIDQAKLTEALHLLNDQLCLTDAPETELVVCGGSALIAANLVPRTTRDIDIIALIRANKLKSAEPLPEYLLLAADRVGFALKLPADWLNNGPASLLSMGLPPGFQDRLSRVVIGEKLVMHYISRLDQIYFKIYAAADRGGYHAADLRALAPGDDELLAAARWCMTQDVSAGFHDILKDMLNQLGWKNVAEQI